MAMDPDARRYWLVITAALFWSTCPSTSLSTARSTDGHCPHNCTCSTTAETIKVNCAGNESSGIERQLNSLIQVHASATKLVVTNSELENLDQVELSPLENLTDLLFENNTRINDLPEGFVKTNAKLSNFIMTASRLENIPRDMFLGLSHLRNVDFSSNLLSTLDPSTFWELYDIQSISLTNNGLTEVDVWPIHLMVQAKNSITINLDQNRIATFTNIYNWTYNCLKKPPKGYLNLKYNHVKHLSDMSSAVAPRNKTDILCLFRDRFHVDVQYNKLVCDCIDFVFYWFIQNNRKMQSLVCDTSPNTALVGKLISSIDLTEFVCDIHGGCPEGCRCLQEPANRTLHINCQGQGLRSLPQSLPQFRNMTGYEVKLNFQNNQLKGLDPRHYFPRLVEVDFAGNKLASVDLRAIQQLANNSKYIYFNNNEIKTLPVEIQHVSLNHVVALTLHGNPWACNCQNDWLLPWMEIIKNRTMRPESILCDSPTWNYKKNIFSLTKNQFCTNPRYANINEIVIFSTSVVVCTMIVLIIPFVIVYKKRVWVYKKFQWHPFDWDECDGEDKQFDAFVSYANEDEAWVLGFINDLEQIGFKILFHRRDFDGGKPVVVNVEEAIDISKRTICMLSPAFVASRMCKWEFDTALTITLQSKKSRLIIVRLEDVPDSDIPSSISLYLRRHTYIEKDSPYFMDSLLYSLPIHRLGRDQRTSRLHQPSERTPLLE